jgi:hypothetical protein
MTTTTTTETAGRRCTFAAPAAGWLITSEQYDWQIEDWADHYEGDSYAGSVLYAANEFSCLLSMSDLVQLLSHHGATVADLVQDIETAQRAGHATHCEQHAGQALIWLGY